MEDAVQNHTICGCRHLVLQSGDRRIPEMEYVLQKKRICVCHHLPPLNGDGRIPEMEDVVQNHKIFGLSSLRAAKW